MRTLPALLACFALSAFAQSPFYFTQPASPADMKAMVTTIRTVVDIQDLTLDEVHRSVVAHGTEDKMVLADWLFHQLDKPAGQSHAGPVPEYKMSGQGGEVTKIFYVSPSATNADLTATVTAMRTVLDLQRLFPYESQKAIVGRGPADKIAAADWMVSQLCPYEGAAPTTESQAYPAPLSGDPHPGEVIRIFRMDPDTPNAGVTATVTAIRTVADIQRLFPYEFGKAIIARATADKIATVEWIVHERSKSADPQAPHQTTLAGETVRMFFVDPQKGQTDLASLVTQIRAKAGIQRAFPFADPTAVILRGRPDQMPVVEAMVAEYAAGSR